MTYRYFLVVLFFCLQQMIHAQNKFELSVRDFVTQPDYAHAQVGIQVRDLGSDEVLFDFNGAQCFIPASTLKLITTATALELLGSDYRFSTDVGFQGKISDNGKLQGDLVLIGGGDPTLGSRYFPEYHQQFFDEWAQKIGAAGIRRVEGDLVLDGSVYDSERVPDTWIWADLGNYFGAQANAFTLYDNCFTITFSSPRKAGKLTKIVSVYPEIAGLTFENEVRSSDRQSDNAWVYGGPFDKFRVIRGTIPRNRRAFSIKASIPQPEQFFAQQFMEALARNGVFVEGRVRFSKVNKLDFSLIYRHQSPSLGEICKVTNFESVNLFAEHLLRQIAVGQLGLGCRENAIKIVQSYWQNKLGLSNSLFMEDGSGLSHFNAVSPEFFTCFLAAIYSNASFLSSLPQAGEGTLASFSTELLPGAALKGKSGSMTRVRCYAGYVKTKNGKTLAFAFMVNHFSGLHSSIKEWMEKLLSLLEADS